MERLAGCPRCGQALSGDPSCPRCGVVFAKLRIRDLAEAAHDQAAQDDPIREIPSSRAPLPWGLIVGFALLLIVGAVGLPRLRSGPPVPSVPTSDALVEGPGPRGPAPPTGPAEAADEPLPPPALALSLAEPVEVPAAFATAGLPQDGLLELARRVNVRGPVGATDVRLVEDLLSQNGTEPGLRRFAAGVFTLAAEGERQRRRYGDAAAYLERATAVDAHNVRPWLSLMALSQEATDWPKSEAAARGALALDPRLAEAWYGLGYALLRQDRNREAAEALRTAAEIRPDGATQALLQRVMAGLEHEKGMTEQQLSHFHVRYDGQAHEAVGREILRALERHYATLASTLDYQPQTTIPVILFTREGYYNASGAPAWAGGNYDGTDGRIRIPIGGLTAGLTPDMDGTLIHELVHAFVYDRTRGVAPRDIHEGLAQYLEGKRVESALSAQQLALLADGHAGGVYGFYMGALAFVEYLVANRGMGGMNDLLRAMGETGSVDEAFKQVHGSPQQAVQRAWRQRLKQQFGS
jgi:tetratricopeptide (TPR) repeat protein